MKECAPAPLPVFPYNIIANFRTSLAQNPVFINPNNFKFESDTTLKPWQVQPDLPNPIAKIIPIPSDQKMEPLPQGPPKPRSGLTLAIDDHKHTAHL